MDVAKGRQKWTPDQLDHAAADCILDNLSYRKAADRWDVPKSTVSRYVCHLSPEEIASLRAKRGRAEAGLPISEAPAIKKRIIGHSTVLTAKEEDFVEQQALAWAERNLPFTRRTIVDLARRILRHRKHTTLRRTPKVGLGWCKSFLLRHERLALRIPQALSTHRDQSMTREIAESHLDTLRTVLERHGLRDAPRRIWNVDETGFKLGERGGHGKVIAARGVQKVYVRTPADSQHVTMVCAVNAAGEYGAVGLILSGARPPPQFMGTMEAMGLNEWAVGCGKKGFVTTETFFDWLKLFCEELDNKYRKENRGEEHLLILDQCSCHASLRILEYAEAHHVLLYGLPPHTTHYTQPADVGIFGPLKAHFWNAETDLMVQRDREFRRRLKSWSAEAGKPPIRREISIADLPILMATAIRETMTRQTITSAFRKTGIYPYCREELLTQVCATSNDSPAPAVESLIDGEGEDEDEMSGAEDDDELEIEELFADDEEMVLRKATPRMSHPKLPQIGLQKLSYFMAQRSLEVQQREIKAMMMEEKRMLRSGRKEAQEEQKRSGNAAHKTKRKRLSALAVPEDATNEGFPSEERIDEVTERVEGRPRGRPRHSRTAARPHDRDG